MLCPNCQQEFDSGLHLPRILVYCGHTYCQECIQDILSTSEPEASGKVSLSCPECDTLNMAHDGVNSFPKNLVLLQVSSQSIMQAQNKNQQNSSNEQPKTPSNLIKQNSSYEHKIQRENSTKSNNSQGANQTDSIKVLCPIHNKKLEAFCEKDLQVLCIDCILSEAHKSHEIISVQKAAEKQRQFLYEEVLSAQKSEEKLRFILSDLKRHVGDLHLIADKNRKELSQIYSYVRDLILEREQTLKRQISENLTKEEQEAEAKQGEINEFIGGINNLKQELLQQNQENEIEILMKARQRSLLSSEVNGTKSRELITFNISNVANASLSLQEVKRDQELTQISKILNPTYKGPSIGQTIGQSTNLYSHTASTANKMKKANTQNPIQASSNFQNGLGQYSNPFQNQADKGQNQDRKLQQQKLYHNANNSINSNPMKSKVSPHRMQSKKTDQPTNQTKKQGVTVLDQNKQKAVAGGQTSKNTAKVQNSFQNVAAQQNQINLSNFNQFGGQIQSLGGGCHQEDLTEDALANLAPEDVSSIYPLETNECYFQYQDHNQNMGGRNNFVRRDESVGNLKDLLESLEKSASHDDPPLLARILEVDKNASSTASETGGSVSDQQRSQEINDPNRKLNKVASQESPKIKKSNNGWKNPIPQHKNKSGKKSMLKKDNSTSDLQEGAFKNMKNLNPQINEIGGSLGYPILEESSHDIPRSGSLNRYGASNQPEQMHPSPGKRYVNLGNQQQQTFDEGSRKQRFGAGTDNSLPPSNHHQMCNLSLERAKRKQQKIGAIIASQESSPFKVEKKQEGLQLMDMLTECTKNIDKLEIRHGQKRNFKNPSSNSESPVKLLTQHSNKATVCVVDLTRKEDNDEVSDRREEDQNQEYQAIDREEDDEGAPAKNIPNMTKTKDQSPIKADKLSLSSPRKQDILKSHESMENLMVQVVRNTDLSVEVSKQSSTQMMQESFLQQSVAVDTSVSDPFRAFCKIREEFIFVFSGFNDQKLLSCETLDVQRGTWKEICTIGKARTKFSAVPISKSRILIFGGKQADGQRTGEIEEYNLKTNKFKTLPFKLPKPRSGFSACVKREEGKIFFCGGNSGSVLRKFDCLDLKKGKWSRCPEMIQKRDELAVALGPDGMIYAIGGYGGGSQANNTQGEDKDSKDQSTNCLKTAERFNFQTGEWEMLPEMNEARRALAAVALPDGIYAIGGYDGKQYLSSVEKFDLQKQQWINVKPMNTSRCTLSAVASSDCMYIYAIGGFNGASLDLVERFNTMSDQWEFITPMNTKRFMHEAVCLVTQ